MYLGSLGSEGGCLLCAMPIGNKENKRFRILHAFSEMRIKRSRNLADAIDLFVRDL
jgi:hypothetical protein